MHGIMNIKIRFNINLSSGSRVVPYGWRDGHAETKSRFSQICELHQKKKKTLLEENGVGKNGNVSRFASFIIAACKRAMPFMLCVLNNVVSATEVYTSNDTWRRPRTLNM